MTFRQRLASWWRTRQRIRRWQRLPPEQQLALWLKTIDENPELREQFRRALRVKAADAHGEYRERLRAQR